MSVSQLMTSSPVTCRSTSTLYEAAHLMAEREVGSLPVVDDDGRLLGMLTDRDVCLSAYEHDQALRVIPVSAAMSARVFACGPDDAAEDAMHTMTEHRLRRLPVVDRAGQVVGILSIDDLAGAATMRGAEVTEQDVSGTLAAITGTAPAHMDSEC